MSRKEKKVKWDKCWPVVHADKCWPVVHADKIKKCDKILPTETIWINFFPNVTLEESLAKNTKIVIRCKRYKSNLFILRHNSSVLSKKITKNVVEKLFIWLEGGAAATMWWRKKMKVYTCMHSSKGEKKKKKSRNSIRNNISKLNNTNYELT